MAAFSEDVSGAPILVTTLLARNIAIDASVAPLLHRAQLGATTYPYVYVSDYLNDRVNVYDWYGHYQFSFGTTGSGNGQFNGPWGVATNGFNVFVTDVGNNRVQVFTMTGVYLAQFGTAGSALGEFVNPKGIALTSAGIWVVDSGNNRFQVFSYDYEAFFEYGEYGSGAGQFNGPTDAWIAGSYFAVLDAGNNRTFYFPLSSLTSILPAADQTALDGDVTLPALESTGEASSSFLIAGDDDASLPALTVSAFTAARMVASLAPMTAEGEAYADLVATLIGSLPGLQVSSDLSVTGFGTLDGSLPALLLTASGSAGSVGSASLTLPALRLSTIGYGGTLLTVDASLPALESYDGLVLVDVTGTALLTLPALEMVAFGHVISGVGTFSIVSMNTRRTAVTEYSNYGFNSMAEDGDNLYLASSSGLFYATGTTDDDANGVAQSISAHARFARQDMFAGSGDMPTIFRKVREAYLLWRGNGRLVLTINVDEDSYVYTYLIDDINTALHETRQKFARGMDGRVFDFKIENVSGSDFEISNLRVKAEPFTHRRR